MPARRAVMNPVQLLRPARLGDERGWFSETFHAGRMAQAGIADVFVQDNHTLSRAPFTLRGLHFQSPPFAQAKLVRCIAGRIQDVAVDLRQGSPTYGHHVCAQLSAADGCQIYIPEGFAHGFLTLEPGCEVEYKVSAHYSAEHDGGLAFDDPDLAIAWQLPAGTAPVLSPKDRMRPGLRDLASPFAYDGRPLSALPPLEMVACASS